MTAAGFLSVDGKTIYQMNDFTVRMVDESMKYRKVTIEALGYELAPVVVTSTELEARLEPLYKYLRIAPGQLQALTGIRERRWWEPGYRAFRRRHRRRQEGPALRRASPPTRSAP